MPSRLERSTSAARVAVLDANAPIAPKPTPADAAVAERAERHRVLVERWKAIQSAGGREAWIVAELRAKGLLVTTDPKTLSDAERGEYKEKKKLEAAERRALLQQAWQAHRATHVVHVGRVFFRDTDREANDARDARLARARENGVDAIDSVDKLAEGLGLTVPELRWLAYHREASTTSHYRSWTIPKRDGSRRTITAPKRKLKAAQRWILRNIVDKLPVHQAAHGFLAGRSIQTNAAMHAGADVVLKIDVKDFFPTVTYARVKGLLRQAGLVESVATLAALIVTESPRDLVSFRGKTLFVAKGPRALPQGAPTSPGITNAICVRLDRRMSGLARMLGATYTRYADDLAFSFGRGDASTDEDEGAPRPRPPIGTLLRGAREILESEGFVVHDKKTTVRRSGSSQRVTGLVVNRSAETPPGVAAARVPRDVVRRLKAAIWNREKGRASERHGESLEQLKGLAAFVHMTDPKRGRAFLERLSALERREKG
ncbi:MAG: reverse transcriptase family protein [Polyangiaceae bacterium]